MGDPRFPRKHYDTPSHPWQKERIEKENALVHQYGLKNKREIWKASTNVRQMRQQARKLTATASEQAQKERRLLLGRLDRLGLLDRGSNLEDVLRMDVEKLLDRRLQTQVYLQGLASTPKQSRQLITHGHITIEGTVARVAPAPAMSSSSKIIRLSFFMRLRDQTPVIKKCYPQRESALLKESI